MPKIRPLAEEYGSGEAAVYVPKAKLAAYRGAKHWTAFKNVKGN